MAKIFNLTLKPFKNNEWNQAENLQNTSKSKLQYSYINIYISYWKLYQTSTQNITGHEPTRTSQRRQSVADPGRTHVERAQHKQSGEGEITGRKPVRIQAERGIWSLTCASADTQAERKGIRARNRNWWRTEESDWVGYSKGNSENINFSSPTNKITLRENVPKLVSWISNRMTNLSLKIVL